MNAVRLSFGNPPATEECQVIAEQPVTIAVEEVGDYTLMCTPSDVVALAVGFAFTERLISRMGDIYLLQRCEEDQNRIRMRLSDTAREGATQARNLIVASSCGMCGAERIEDVLNSLPVCGQTLRVSFQELLEVHEKMKSCQALFRDTGGAHAAALFTPQGEIAAFAEDIGRHNALDKAIGKCLLLQKPTAGSGVAFSGRAGFEIVVKAARAGIELIAAVSAPSSLAVQAAERCGITLCGFVRGDRATVFCHEFRVAT